MPPKKRARVAPIVVSDLRVKIDSGKSSSSPSDFRVSYTIILSERCCNSGKEGKRIFVRSTKQIWEYNTDEEKALHMRDLTFAALERHKQKALEDGISCRLNYHSKESALPQTDTMWRYVWGYADNEIRKAIMENDAQSLQKKKGHETRTQQVLDKEWEGGADFDSNYQKFRAKQGVMNSLQYWSGKSISRVITILTHILNKLRKVCRRAAIDFDPHQFLLQSEAKKHKLLDAMLRRGKECIAGMKQRISKEKLQLLTGVAAIFALPQDTGMQHASMRLIGINPRSSYAARGIENRAAYENFLKLKGDIAIGEMVLCRAGFGKLIRETEDSLTISLEPWRYEKEYKSSTDEDGNLISVYEKARLARWEPSLDDYEREEYSNTVPEEWKMAIDTFHRSHNHTSPNMKDPAKRRHPLYPTQIEEKPRIYRYETWNQLWSEFQTTHPGIADKIRNPEYPDECPSLIRTCAPWEMVKGKNASCLCVNCEGMNACRRGAKVSVKSMNDLKNNIVDTLPNMFCVPVNDEDNEELVDAPALPADDTVADTLQGEECSSSTDGDDDHDSVPSATVTVEASSSGDSEAKKDADAAVKLLRLHEVINAKTKYDACVACLPCLTSGKLEDANFACVNGDCPKCGFDKIWSKGLRRRILSREFDSEKSEWVEKLNASSVLATDVWTNSVDWRAYVVKEKPSVGEHLREVNRQAAATVRPAEADDGDYSPANDSKSARNLTLETCRGTVIDYFDHVEKQIKLHLVHRNLVSSEFRSKKDYERNSRPWSVEKDIDFSENGPIENFDKAQSEHWQTEQYTLFMSVNSFLVTDIWNSTDSNIEKCDEVTVDGEFYLKGQPRPEINKHSFWAVVTECIGGNLYRVEDNDGNVFDIERDRLRLRKRHTVCCPHVSDDKKHDRFAMQQFSTVELDWLEGYMREEFPNDIPEGRITHLHLHSDNATQHFKSCGAINFFTSLISDRGGATVCCYVYSFGAPGHGKGFFDGLGGALKNKIASLIKGSKTGGDTIPGTESGYISSVEDVHAALKEYFENGRDGLRQKKSKNRVDKFKFFKHLASERPIRRAEETFTRLEEIHSSYQFVVTNVGIVHSRKRSCWCMDCTAAMYKGSLEWNADHKVSGCVSSALQTTSVYDFRKRVCTKLTGPDVGVQLSVRRKNKNEMAARLTPGGWVIFKGSGETDELIWLGRTLSKSEWGNECILKNNSRGTKNVEGAAVVRNGYAINVQWYRQKVVGILEYVVDDSTPVVQSNNDLLLAGFDDRMHQVYGSRTRVPRRRTVRANRMDTFGLLPERTNLQTSEGDWYRREYGNLWRMDQQVRNEALEGVD